MSKPFELGIAEYYPRNAYPIYSGSDEAMDKTLDFMDTKVLDVKFNYELYFKIKATTEQTQKLDVLFTNAMMSVLLSSKTMVILNELCPEQFQVFDATIECKDGVVDTYKAINILNEVNVSDPEKSVMSKVVGYLKCVFKEQPIEPIHIARDAKFHPAIIISATLKEAFEKAKVKGCQYRSGD
jgi:hypothetical protein